MKRNMNTIIASGRSLLLGLCIPFPMFAAADTTEPFIPAGAESSTWVCEYCPVDEGFSGELEAGPGYVSDDSFKFGEYNGLQDDGTFLLGNAMARYRDAKGGYLDLQARDLGIDTRQVDIKGGRQGRYSLFLNYDEIPHYISDSARTPYRGIGGTSLTLPAGWVYNGSTAGMTQLDASLQDVELKTKRKRFSLGIDFIPARRWETAVNVRHELRDGQKRTAGAIYYTNSAELIEPVDYVTDEVEVAVTYTTRKWQSRLAYYGSFFNNHDASLEWKDAFNSNVNRRGRMSLPPDNQFHQVQLSSGYQLGERTRISGDIAAGRMEQDEALLDASVNNPPALPRNSAQAKIDTLTANLKLDSAVTDKLRLNAAYRYNDRDNKTPIDVFSWVSTDAFAGPDRMNHPYSFTDHTAKLGGAYRFNRSTRLSAGYEYEKRERTNLEVDDTKEDTVWGRLGVRVHENLDLAVRVAHAERDASGYHQVNPTQNPLLRKYNMADRNRDTGSIQAGFNPHERLSIGLSASLSRDDYSDSAVGLTGDREVDYNADASLILTDATSLHAFAGRQHMKSSQASIQDWSTSPLDWFAKYDDTIDSFGIGAKHQLIRDRLDIGVDYALLHSISEVSIDTGTPGLPFPDLKTELDTVKLYADYRLKDDITLHAAYWYENYDSRDWALDGVGPATLSNVISLGRDSPDYEVHAVMLSLRYRF